MDCRAGRLSGRYCVVMYKPKKTKTEMKTGLLSLCCALMLFASCGKRIPKSDAVAIVPKPVSEQLSDSTFDLTKRTRIRLLADDSTLLRSTDFFNGVVSKAFGKGLYVAQGGQAQKDAINVRLDDSLPSEGYTLLITPDSIDIAGGSPAGVFYAFQSLRQLLPAAALAGERARVIELPAVEIRDEPHFAYRGAMLDACRHFFKPDEVKEYLDLLALHKINRFHWHLTDDQGWRIEIKKYPELTTVGSVREKDLLTNVLDTVRKFDENPYGGFYTQDQIRDIVKYAADRFITVIPEIEMPGHATAALAAYPYLGCVGKDYKVTTLYGIQEDAFCAGKDSTFGFLEDVLSEVIDLFPSEYIHVGGDEAGKSAWKKCSKCQALMKEKGMKNVDELQSYMIHRAEEFLNSKDRKLIGWDEILEGGLAPEATVMSWRGEDGGIKSARMGHDVVMTPGNYMYLDFYQADPKTQPYAIGGYTPIKKVYSYDPVPADSLTAEECRHILGVQANTWTEYIQTPEHLEYMMFPRALAVAEIGWTPQELRTWEDFKPRMNAHISKLQGMGIRTFTLSDELEVTMQVDTAGRKIEVILDAEKYPAEIRYTTDGSVPVASSALYAGPITVQDSAHIKAAIFRDGVLQGTPTEKKVDYHRAINKPIHYNSKLYEGYMAGGTNALLDGYRGGLTYLDGRWQGYLDDLDCVIDMEEETDIHKVSIRFMQLIGPGVFQPGQVELLTSEDGENFISRGIVPTTVPADDPDLLFQEYTFDGNWKTRYIRLKAPRANPGFIFADEIVVW